MHFGRIYLFKIVPKSWIQNQLFFARIYLFGPEIVENRHNTFKINHQKNKKVWILS